MFEKSNDPKRPYLLYCRRLASTNRRAGRAADPRAARTCALRRQERGPLLRDGHPYVTHDRAVRGTNRPSHCPGRPPRTVQGELLRSVSGPAARAGYRRRPVTDAQVTRWLASATQRTATGAECAHRPHRAPSQGAPQGRFRIRASEGSLTAVAPGAAVAGPRGNTRRRPRAAGPMPVEHRGCRKRHFHSRRRVDSQVGARHGSRGRRRGR